jgi:predicted transcriptional regulator
MSERRRSGKSKVYVQETIRLSAEGLAKVLGDLEARVMQSVWRIARPATAREVYEVVAREHDVAIHTVITVLNRLVRKGLLKRRKRSDLLHYEARWSEAEFMKEASRRVVEGILSFGSSAVATSFVDVLAEVDPERLAELNRLIEERLRQRRVDEDMT